MSVSLNRCILSVYLFVIFVFIYDVIMSFPVFKAAIKGKLQELGAYVGKIIHHFKLNAKL